MTTILASIAWLLLLVSLFLAPLLPSILNLLVAGFIAFKLSKLWRIRLLLLPVLSAVLSWNVRIPHLKETYLTDSAAPEVAIHRKVILGPYEKMTVVVDEPTVYYRRTSSVPIWGFRDNQWRIGITRVPMVVEEPLTSIRQMGIAATDTGTNRVVLRINSEVKNGLSRIRLELHDNQGVAATYAHDPRRNYPFETLDSSGDLGGGWASYLVFLTQHTPWNFQRAFYPDQYMPIKGFLERALAQYGASADGTLIPPAMDSMDTAGRLVDVRLRRDVKVIAAGDLPAPSSQCTGEDSGRKFSAHTTNALEVHWENNDFPPLRLAFSAIDGYLPAFSTASCVENTVWITTNHMGKIHAWKYAVSFGERSLVLKQRLTFAIPVEISGADARNYFVRSIAGDSGGYDILLARYEETPRLSGRVLARGGVLVRADLVLNSGSSTHDMKRKASS